MVNKLHLILLFILLIPQGVMFGMAYDSSLVSNKSFTEIEAVSLASALMLAMIVPSVTLRWLLGEKLDSMRQLCFQVKQGNYQELLDLPNEPRNEEDDIDLFKKINDTYGHQSGDVVLLELATIIRKNAREGDLPARIGGEEYAILLPGTLSQQAVGVANRIQIGIENISFY